MPDWLKNRANHFIRHEFMVGIGLSIGNPMGTLSLGVSYAFHSATSSLAAGRNPRPISSLYVAQVPSSFLVLDFSRCLLFSLWSVAWGSPAPFWSIFILLHNPRSRALIATPCRWFSFLAVMLNRGFARLFGYVLLPSEWKLSYMIHVVSQFLVLVLFFCHFLKESTFSTEFCESFSIVLSRFNKGPKQFYLFSYIYRTYLLFLPLCYYKDLVVT